MNLDVKNITVFLSIFSLTFFGGAALGLCCPVALARDLSSLAKIEPGPPVLECEFLTTETPGKSYFH